jgi:hypothetical protein
MNDITVPAAPALVSIPGVELVQAGTWRLSTGEAVLTRDDLAEAVSAADCPAIRNPVLKLGHIDSRFDGEPAVGWVGNMALADDGNTITGDFRGMPAWLAAKNDTGDRVITSAYPDRSVEATRNFVCQIGHTHPLVITAVALLGVTAPGIGTLDSLQDVAALYDVAAAAAGEGEHITITIKGGSMPTPTPDPAGGPVQVAAGVTSEDVRRRYYENTGYIYWICEIQLDPDLQLIVMDDSKGAYYRVPITVDGDEVAFGDPVAVSVQYVDKPATTSAAAARAAGAVVFASRADSVPADLQAASVSDKPWSDFSESDYTIEQWRKACLISPDSASEDKGDYKIPVREPGGALNRNGCHAAAGGHGIGAVTGASADTKQKAAKKLVGLYRNQLKEDPPASLLKLAGMDDTSSGDTKAAVSSTSKTPVADPASGQTQKENTDMEFSDEQLAAMRAKLGLPEDATLDPAALLDGIEKLAASSGDGSPGTTRNTAGTVVIDQQVYDDMQTRIQRLESIRASQQKNDRERDVDDAIKAGKFPPSRREHWLRVYEKDPEGTAQLLAGLTPGSVPVDDLGVPGDDTLNVDAEFAALYPKGA